jgi:hypothetical protein
MKNKEIAKQFAEACREDFNYINEYLDAFLENSGEMERKRIESYFNSKSDFEDKANDIIEIIEEIESTCIDLENEISDFTCDTIGAESFVSDIKESCNKITKIIDSL